MNHRHLVFDLGNTRLKMGVFEGDELIHSDLIPVQESASILWESWRKTWEPDRIGISSTIQFSGEDQSWIQTNKVLRADAGLKYPFEILYRTPDTLGQDRLAAVSAVYTLYKKKNVLIIDCGTCITYDFLTADGRYIGGNIAPGLRMRLQSMHEYTDRLPLVGLPKKISWIGQSTEEAVQNGGVGMAILESKGFIFYLKENYGHLTTVLTGGDARYFKNHLSGECNVHANLVLSGLNEILKNNEI